MPITVVVCTKDHELLDIDVYIYTKQTHRN